MGFLNATERQAKLESIERLIKIMLVLGFSWDL